ncbi:hypothetical protein IQ13_0527 [Lacibacter cauensis]|uniref:Uncharacterized protein n=1 Tax=Lacibacter cauensis TaxID=510947 RepID=A0A562SVP9_9BACT|nr:hypothetical protein [Lacibacter cauensis]TWI85367.1 hypothetical protein IQ13_0527 [Lacibacter cauensis]
MKHYDFVTAVKLREYYADKLSGLPLSESISTSITNIIACIAGQQQQQATNNESLNIDSDLTPEERIMKIYVVVGYVKNGKDYYFEELENILKFNGLDMVSL